MRGGIIAEGQPKKRGDSVTELAAWKTIPRELKTVFVKRDFGQNNKQQRHFNKQPISEFQEEVDLQ